MILRAPVEPQRHRTVTQVMNSSMLELDMVIWSCWFCTRYCCRFFEYTFYFYSLSLGCKWVKSCSWKDGGVSSHLCQTFCSLIICISIFYFDMCVTVPGSRWGYLSQFCSCVFVSLLYYLLLLWVMIYVRCLKLWKILWNSRVSTWGGEHEYRIHFFILSGRI